MQDVYEALSDTDKQDADVMLAACDMADLPTLKLNRGIGRANNLEVWL